MRHWRAIVLVFLPFAAAYYLSYFFRTINALISATLIADFGLGAASLGMLTSVYFLTFAAIQLPAGIMLDRFGPRRVQSLLLLVAAIGSALFAFAEKFEILVVGRALIGLGVAASLIAGLKAIVVWFPKDRLPLVNGCFIMIGSLGVVTATAPIEVLLTVISRKELFELLPAATAICALAILMLVPDSAPIARESKRAGTIQLKMIYGDRRFWQLSPLSTMCISTAWALQGLWAAPWLADVDGLGRTAIVRHLFIMAVALRPRP